MEDKEGHYIIKKSIHYEDVTIIITYTLIIRAPPNKHCLKLREKKTL